MKPTEQELNARLLESYEQVATQGRGKFDKLFRLLLGASLTIWICVGYALLAMELPPEVTHARNDIRRATFVIDSAVPPPSPAPKPVQPVEPEQVEDLTDSPLLDQETTLPAEAEPEIEKEKPRRVYGVRKVFAKGLGNGGEGNGFGIISKRGNTLAIDPDTLTATEVDLEGPLVGMSTVSQAPNLIGRVKPKYTEEMIINQVRGTVKARLLIDITGEVKKVEMIADLGFGSREVAIDAFEHLRFEPALRDGQPVAVWIIMKYRFEFQD
jgi:Gram-negative bacterial TonB protein C-terminal